MSHDEVSCLRDVTRVLELPLRPLQPPAMTSDDDTMTLLSGAFQSVLNGEKLTKKSWFSKNEHLYVAPIGFLEVPLISVQQ